MNPILVTGGAKRIGSAICLALAASGHDLVIHYKNSEKEADQVMKECRGLGVSAEKIRGDFSTRETLDQFIASYCKQYERTKGVVNNVGNYLLAPLLETKQAEFLDLMQTNLFAPFFITQALVPKICLSGGSIVNLGVNGLHHAKIRSPAYQIAKLALWGFTVTLAKELANKQVTVNMVSPGYTECSVDLKPSSSLPMHRPAYNEEIGKTVAFLFGKESRYITGQNIEVAGGFGL